MMQKGGNTLSGGAGPFLAGWLISVQRFVPPPKNLGHKALYTNDELCAFMIDYDDANF